MLPPVDGLAGAGAQAIEAVAQREFFILQLSFQFNTW